ncbi:MAG: ribonuclease R, partial [Betaproteobacteria bacterium]
MKTRKTQSAPRGRKRGSVRAAPARSAAPGGARDPARSNALRSGDPHLERERAKYAEPLPSRELILQTLEAQGVPVSSAKLQQLLGITDAERETFERRLAAMQREGQIMRNRRDAICLVTRLDLIPGRVQGHADGYGFVIRDDEGPDLFLGPDEMHKVLHGDRVVARESGVDRRGRPEGKIVEVLERANQRVVGRLHSERGVLFVTAENRRISQELLIPPGDALNAQAGQVVVAEIVVQPAKHAQPIARVVEVLGNYADPGMEIEIALRKHALPYIFSRVVEKVCAKFTGRVEAADSAGREDLRKLPLVTIDGETAKDFD